MSGNIGQSKIAYTYLFDIVPPADDFPIDVRPKREGRPFWPEENRPFWPVENRPEDKRSVDGNLTKAWGFFAEDGLTTRPGATDFLLSHELERLILFFFSFFIDIH